MKRPVWLLSTFKDFAKRLLTGVYDNEKFWWRLHALHWRMQLY